MGSNHKPIYGFHQYPLLDIYFMKNPPMDISKTIGTNLTALMEETSSLDTCKKVSARSGVGFGTVQRAKNGEGNITVEKLASIASVFRVHPAELLRDKSSVEHGYNADTIEYTIDRKSTISQLECKEPDPATILDFPSPLLHELARIASSLSDAGLHRLIERAEELAVRFPKQSEGNAAN